MDKDNRIGKQKEHCRRNAIHPNSVITTDSRNLLLLDQTYRALANTVSNKYLGRKMTSPEIRALESYIRKMNFSSLYGMKYCDAVSEMARRFMEYRNGHQPRTVGMTRDNSLSLKDWQKNEIGTLTGDEHPYKYATFPDKVGETGHKEVQDRRIRTTGHRLEELSKTGGSGSAGIMCCLDELSDTVRSLLSADHIGRIIKQSWNNRITYDDLPIRNLYIPFDSIYRDITVNEPPPLATPVPTYIAKLSFLINRTTDSRASGMRIGQDVREYVEMTTHEIILPWARDLDIFHSRITLLIEELREQSAFEGGDTGRRYHFVYSVEKRAHPVDAGEFQIVLTPIISKFRFYHPIAQLDRATFIFRNPYDYVRLPLDLIKFDISGASPAVFTTSAGVAHGLPSGTYVYIEGVVAGTDSQNGDFNRQEGHVINVTGATTFEVTVAGGNDIQLNLSDPQTSVSVWVGSRRFRIPISFKTLE